MDIEKFESALAALFHRYPELQDNIFGNRENLETLKKCIQENTEDILKKLSISILDVKYTYHIGLYLESWLLEFLNILKKNVVKCSDEMDKVDLSLHRSLCVCVSHLLHCDIEKFVVNYFKEAPPPFSSVIEVDEEISIPMKRMKFEHLANVPKVEDEELVKATFRILNHFGVAIAENWQLEPLLRYLDHEDESVRWYTCGIFSLIFHMNEVEKNVLFTRYVSNSLNIQMMHSSQLNTSTPIFHRPVGNQAGEGQLKLNHLCGVGRVLLPVQSHDVEEVEITLVNVESTLRNLEAVALAVNSSQPVLIEGLVGSGKTSLVEYLASLTRRCRAPHLTKLQLSDQTDSKTLIGSYMCTATPGEFIWQPGSLTKAVTAGHWLLLEDIDFAPLDTVSLLIPLLESRTLLVPGRGNIKAHPNFQVFATRRMLPAGCKARSGTSVLLEKLWMKVSLISLSASEIRELICVKWPELISISEKLVEVYLALSYGQHGGELSNVCAQCSSPDLSMSKTSGRFVTVRDLMKWCSRLSLHIDKQELNVRAFQEALDCFCSAIPKSDVRFSVALHIGAHLNINQPLVDYYLSTYNPDISIKTLSFNVGTRGKFPRKSIHRVSLRGQETTFSKTRLFANLLEQVTVAVMNQEPVLIVGETGTGKTSTVQYLAQQTNNRLQVINMNQQSDSTDLLGGFKPVEFRTIVSPLRTEFESLFANTFSTKRNSKFLKHIMMAYVNNKWNDLLVLISTTASRAEEKLINERTELTVEANSKSKVSGKGKSKQKTSIDPADVSNRLDEIQELLEDWKKLKETLKVTQDTIERVKSSLAFSFIEGTLVKAVQKGEWVLLDEINLASADTLECLSSLLESSIGSLTLHERGDSKPLVRHPDFRLFACMNPATDVGKKELPAGLRNRFTEFFMEEAQLSDLKQIIADYLREFNPSVKQIDGIAKFYQKVKRNSSTALCDGTGHKPHFSLRTLCRALIVTKKNPFNSLKRNLYESFCLSFLTQLDDKSYGIMLRWIVEDVLGKAALNTTCLAPMPGPDYMEVEGFWVPKGEATPESTQNYILTDGVRKNLRDLVRIVSIGRFPVLLQGDTSVGKTSLITYLARRTGNPCVRINNHQHTDLQEYIGQYSPDETGKLVFQEGALVKAMRNGHWLILDELNLAPTDVLEALNRLLDENRELFIPEIETTVKADPKFMLFATQNPSGVYGGRQVLSRAFRNRFIELHFDRIPERELEIILHQRCKISPSLAKRMVAVLKELQTRRRESNLFQGKQSFITLRDLFRWAERYSKAANQEGLYDWNQHVADEGYLVLAGKIRVEEETDVIREVLKKHLKSQVNPDNLFTLSEHTSSVTKPILEKLCETEDFEHVVWTYDMRRLYVLVAKALSFLEPVLLVGETGCGKTTVCQILASMSERRLFTVNCHMHTEGADFLGGLRPVRDRLTSDDDRLFEWVDGPLINAMKSGGYFLADEISLADDSVLERLNSVLEPERTLLVSEKGSNAVEGVEDIVAHDHFRLIGTMNPGGDYGKKELSPAFRNRMTEIWCPKLEISRSASDIKLIICRNLRTNSNELIGDLLVKFLKDFTLTELGKKLTVSLRDILSWVDFINTSVLNGSRSEDVGLAYVHGACLVLLDSLGSGISGNSIHNWKGYKEKAMQYLCLQAQNLNPVQYLPHQFTSVSTFRDDENVFGVEPFLITKGKSNSKVPVQFSFKAPNTCLNLMRLLRGLQLSRPILLEGSPGVGKTSLVVALAKASCNNIVRINLSEQTDVSDLFGADLPVEGSDAGRFAWRDGPLLQALKNGSWVVFDELNLASQSVLEGLNACFDHRGEIFVPELNKTFKVEHQLTKIFACQNPQYQGGARKGLPKSFLNRFTQVYVEPLSSDDLMFILSASYPTIPQDILSLMVRFNDKLVQGIHVERKWGSKGGPWELNLRDMLRWCQIMLANEAMAELNPGLFVELIYADRMRTESDRSSVLGIYKEVFDQLKYPVYSKSGTVFVDDRFVQFGRAVFPRKGMGKGHYSNMLSDLYLLHGQTPYLESLVNCINMNWMTLLVGDSGQGKTSIVQLLADLAGHRLETLSVNSHMDVTELVGGFEQADFGVAFSSLCDQLKNIVWGIVRSLLVSSENVAGASEYLTRWRDFMNKREKGSGMTNTEEVDHFIQSCRSMIRLIKFLEKRHSKIGSLQELRSSCVVLCERATNANTVMGGGGFEWVDSALVKAVREGHWLLIDGVNLCSASVLDRLNGLLEPGGVLTLAERGVIDGQIASIDPHPEFRLFLTMNPQHGEISRAMRNRGVEICMLGMWQNEMDVKALLLSRQLDNNTLQNVLIKIFSAISEALPKYERPSHSSLGQAGLLTRRLLRLGETPEEAVRLASSLVYIKNYGKSQQKLIIEEIINSCVDEIPSNFTLKSPNEVDGLALSAKSLLSSSSLGVPEQFSSLCSLIPVTNDGQNGRNLEELTLPHPLPSSKNKLEIGIFVCLTAMTLKQWDVFKYILCESDFKKAKLKNILVRVTSNPTVDGGEFVCVDPRFNSLCSQGYDDSIVSTSNKDLLALWIDIFMSECRPNSKKQKKGTKSVFNISKDFLDGFINEIMIYHPSLRFIYSFLNLIRGFFLTLSKVKNIELEDSKYYEILEGLEWIKRLENVCQKRVSSETFHLFLPEFAFHWQQVQSCLMDRISPFWYKAVENELEGVAQSLQESFKQFCSSLHVLIPELRSCLKPPLPFQSETSSKAYKDIIQLAECLSLSISDSNKNEVNNVLMLTSEPCVKIRIQFVDLVFRWRDLPPEMVSEKVLSQKKALDSLLEKNDRDPLDTFGNVQLLPLVDFFVTRQLQFSNTEFEISRGPRKVTGTHYLCEMLEKSSHIPIGYMDNFKDPEGEFMGFRSNSLCALSLYLFQTQNTSGCRPHTWIDFDDTETPENAVEKNYWSGEDNFVLSPMSNLLSYHLLTGFTHSVDDANFISIGNHSERQKQLKKIRSTLIENWPFLHNVSFDYVNCFEGNVTKFVSDLAVSLAYVLNVYDDDFDELTKPEMIIECLNVVNTPLKTILNNQGSYLLLNLINSSNDYVNCGNLMDLAKMGVCGGLLQTWLLSHMEPLDPVLQNNLLVSYYKQDLSHMEDFLLMFQWVKCLRFNGSEDGGHPHVDSCKQRVKDLQNKVKELSRKIAFRPETSQYCSIIEDISHFVQHVFVPSRVLDLVKQLQEINGKPKSDQSELQSTENFLRSCENFLKKMVSKYPLYADLTAPFLYGVAFVCECIRVMMVLNRNKSLSIYISEIKSDQDTRSGHSHMNQVLIDLLKFQRIDDPLDFNDPESFAGKLEYSQTKISELILSLSGKEDLFSVTESLSLRASSFDLYNFVVKSKSFESTSFEFMQELVSKAIICWADQEEQRKKKAEDKESLFQYKARTLAISETEEEELERKFLELFPDFQDDFKDMENGVEDMETDTVSKSNDDDDFDGISVKLQQKDIEEILKIHRFLTTNFKSTSPKRLGCKIESMTHMPILLRLKQAQLLFKEIGPCGFCNVDRESIGSYLILNHKLSSGSAFTKASFDDRPNSFYHDPAPDEALKVKPILMILLHKVNGLLKQWPSHPTLVQVIKVVNRVLGFAVSSPLIRLVSGLESVMETCHEWEQNAHRNVSLAEELSLIKEQVIKWRKEELMAWRSCLDLVAYKVKADANKYWPHMYRVMIISTPSDSFEIIKVLKQFMETALIGDFKNRLDILYGISCHLDLQHKFSGVKEDKNLRTACDISCNMYNYFSQFQMQIQDKMLNHRKSIQKDVSNYVKIARWNDVNFFSIKDSVTKSRRTLLTHMHKMEKYLKEPVAPLLTDSFSDIAGREGEWDKNKWKSHINFQTEVVCDVPNRELRISNDQSPYMSKINSLTKKSCEFIKSICEGMSYHECTEAVEDLIDEIKTTYQGLATATAKAEAITDKEDRLRHFKDLVNRKKKNASLLFKTLHHRGVSYTKGNSLWKDEDLDKSFLLPSLDVQHLCTELTLKERFRSVDKYFYRSIGRLSLLSNSLGQAHPDLGPEDIKKLMGFSRHLHIICCVLRQEIPGICNSIVNIDKFQTEINLASEEYYAKNDEFLTWWDGAYGRIISLSLIVEELIAVLQSYKHPDPLVTLNPSRGVTDEKIDAMLKCLSNMQTRIENTVDLCHLTNPSLSSFARYNLNSKHGLNVLRSIIESVSNEDNEVNRVFFESNYMHYMVHDYSTMPFVESLENWRTDWFSFSDGFKDWSKKLAPVSLDTYETSEKAEKCVYTILKSIEDMYKAHCVEKTDISEDDGVKLLISRTMTESLVRDIKCLRVSEVNSMLTDLIQNQTFEDDVHLMPALCLMNPLLKLYCDFSRKIMVSVVESFQELSKLESVLLGIFQQLAVKGFCRPQDMEEEGGEGEGATSFEDSGPGLAEGQGEKDVSERLESEDQLESALQEGEKEAPGNSELQEENGIEMSQDFEGDMQNMDDEEKQDDNDKDKDEEEEEFDKQMGETGAGADKLDEKLWGDENEEEEQEDKNLEDEEGPGDGETSKSEIVAKEDDKGNEDKEQKKKPQTMEEDRREPEQEVDESTYGDDFVDKHAGNDPDEDEDNADFELPEDMAVDGKDREDEEVPGSELDPEIEEKELFPEEEKEQKEKSEEANEDEQTNEDHESSQAEQKQSEEEPNENDEDKSNQKEFQNDKENEDPELKTAEDDKPVPSEDRNSTEGAQDAQMDTESASNDNTKEQSVNRTEDIAADEEFEQEEQGEAGERTEDVTGVGESDTKTNEDTHRGQNSSLESKDNANDRRKEQDHRRKPGETNDNKTLGDTKQEIHHGLLTKESKEQHQDTEQEPSKEEDNNREGEGRESDLYEHVNIPEDAFDQQTVDAATVDQSKTQPAPEDQESENAEEDKPEGAHDTLPEEEEDNMATDDQPAKKRQADVDKNEEEPRGKKLKGEQDESKEAMDTHVETEGEVIPEMLVQRPIENLIETKLENQDEVLAAIFAEDEISTRENVEEAGEGDEKSGVAFWSQIEGKIAPLALQLSEQLRLILEPTETAKLCGDFRTGKRLNMRKIIPYIASQFRKDKIWLRRRQPSKRSYQVLLAVDDSESMSEVSAGPLARESVALVAKALTLLEVGQVGVLSFGVKSKLLHPFQIPFSDQAGSRVFANIAFDQPKSDFSRLLEDATALLAGARAGHESSSDLSQLLLIISDGQTHARSESVKAAVRAAREAKVFVVFFVLDDKSNSYSFYDNMVYEEGELKPMVDTFPFPFFIVVRDVEGLPDAVATALRQWFELVTAER